MADEAEVGSFVAWAHEAMGGLNALAGPLLGAGAFTWLSDTLARATEYWHAVLGAIILLIVIAFPMGIGGAIQMWMRRVRGTPLGAAR